MAKVYSDMLCFKSYNHLLIEVKQNQGDTTTTYSFLVHKIREVDIHSDFNLFINLIVVDYSSSASYSFYMVRKIYLLWLPFTEV